MMNILVCAFDIIYNESLGTLRKYPVLNLVYFRCLKLGPGGGGGGGGGVSTKCLDVMNTNCSKRDKDEDYPPPLHLVLYTNFYVNNEDTPPLKQRN